MSHDPKKRKGAMASVAEMRSGFSKVGGKSERTGQRLVLHRGKPARLKKSLDSSYHHRAGILLVQGALDHRRGENSGQTVEAICNGTGGACAMLDWGEGRDRVDGDDVRFISGFLAVKIIAEYNWWKIEK